MALFTDAELRESPLYEQLYNRRMQMSLAQRERTRNTEPRRVWLFPFSAERRYATWIDQEFRENVVQPANQFALQNYNQLLEESRLDGFRKDGLGDILRGLKEAVSRAFNRVVRISEVADDVDTLNAREWGKFVEEATGVDLNIFAPNASQFVQEWIDENTEYLRGLPDQYVNSVFQVVSEGVAQGLSRTAISRNLSEAGRRFRTASTRVSQRRSERIARDQVGKLQSQLSRARMHRARVDVYRWSTAGDERVRGNPSGLYPNTRRSHFIMDGKYKQVDNPRKISDNGEKFRNIRGREEPRHAGQAINCRCTMIPTFIRLKTVVDKDIAQAA